MIRVLLFIFLIVIFQGCAKQKAILICGDHICVNNNEAKQYFEENLSLEIKIIEKSKENYVDLVQLNLKDNSEKRKEINILKKDKTDQVIKSLSNEEIKKIKENIKKKRKIERVVKKQSQKKQGQLKVSTSEEKKKKILKKDKDKSIIPTDICTVLENCSIDEISKYLIKLGKKRDFPDITTRENNL